MEDYLMGEHRIEATLERDGELTLEGLPFHAGEHVEIRIVPMPDVTDRRRALRGKPVALVDPFAPVAEADWDAVR
jgi:hypothetical protein